MTTLGDMLANLFALVFVLMVPTLMVLGVIKFIEMVR